MSVLISQLLRWRDERTAVSLNSLLAIFFFFPIAPSSEIERKPDFFFFQITKCAGQNLLAAEDVLL